MQYHYMPIRVSGLAARLLLLHSSFRHWTAAGRIIRSKVTFIKSRAYNWREVDLCTSTPLLVEVLISDCGVGELSELSD